MPHPSTQLFSSAYFGPIQYYANLLNGSENIIECFDHYSKQTYRNRTVILSGNGPLALTIPVVKTDGNKTITKDIQIFNQEKWQRLHLRALTAAYQNSPFYEFYIDALMPAFEKEWKFLLDLNLFTVEVLAQEMEVDIPFSLSEEYMNSATGTQDFRDLISPKSNAIQSNFLPQKYHQVFWDRFEFTPNLSILDVLFNKGPETADYLKQSIY